MRWLPLILILGACASSAPARRTTPAAGQRVRSVTISGNSAVSEEEIVEGLELHRRPEAFDPVALELDRKRVVTFYRSRGYYSAAVERVDVEPVAGGAVDVRFTVVEGPPTRITTIAFEGAPDGLGADALCRAAALREGDVFVHARYVAAKERLRVELMRRGWAHALVEGDVRVHRGRRAAELTLRLDPGPRARFGRTRIEGLGNVPESAVRARLAWAEGDRFDPARLELTRSRLYELGRFNWVSVDFDRERREESVEVTVRVGEATRNEARLGGGLEWDPERFELRFRAAYARRGLVDALTTARVDLRPTYRVYAEVEGGVGAGGTAVASLEREDLFVDRVRGLAEVAYALEATDAYEARGPRLRLSVGRPFIDDRLVVGAGWQLRRLDILEVDADVQGAAGQVIGLVDPYRVAFFEQSAVFDRRDNPLDARRGYYGEVRLEEGGALAGGSFDYVKVTPDFRLYGALGRRVVCSWRLRLGAANGVDGAVPITQRYFSGGVNGHRGFAYRRLAPAVGNTPIGGEALLETSVQGKVDLVKLWGYWLAIALFFDGGDVGGELSDVVQRAPHVAFGGGLRWRLPVGAVLFDVGYRLNRTGATEPDPGATWAWHLAIGEAF